MVSRRIDWALAGLELVQRPAAHRSPCAGAAASRQGQSEQRKRCMRKATLLAAALAVAVVAADPAFAATTKNTVSGSIKSTKVGTTKKPVGHALFTQVTTTNDDGTQPPPVRTTIITYPKELEFNNGSFKTCSKALLDAQGPTACPKGSQVGTGSSDAILGSAPIKDIKVTAFNGGKGKIELYVGSPLQKTIEGTQKGS